MVNCWGVGSLVLVGYGGGEELIGLPMKLQMVICDELGDMDVALMIEDVCEGPWTRSTKPVIGRTWYHPPENRSSQRNRSHHHRHARSWPSVAICVETGENDRMLSSQLMLQLADKLLCRRARQARLGQTSPVVLSYSGNLRASNRLPAHARTHTHVFPPNPNGLLHAGSTAPAQSSSPFPDFPVCWPRHRLSSTALPPITSAETRTFPPSLGSFAFFLSFTCLRFRIFAPSPIHSVVILTPSTASGNEQQKYESPGKNLSPKPGRVSRWRRSGKRPEHEVHGGGDDLGMENPNNLGCAGAGWSSYVGKITPITTIGIEHHFRPSPSRGRQAMLSRQFSSPSPRLPTSPSSPASLSSTAITWLTAERPLTRTSYLQRRRFTMASLRYIVPALAVASGVSGKSQHEHENQDGAITNSSTAQFGGSPCSASEPMTISSQAQATQLASCSTFQGSITVANGTSDSAIDLSGIGHITGDLIFEGSGNIQSITATQLAVIDGAFSLTSLTSLTALNFPSLSSAGSIAWNALPSVSQLSFGTGVQMLKSLNIQNTGLQSLQGINLATVDSLFIVNNLDLSDITMQLGNVTQALTIANNGAQISISFPNLIWANNATIRGAATISTPSLKIVNGSLGFYSGTNQAYSAPNLTAVGSALSFVSNSNLNNISLPSLKAIGGALYVVNNTNLENVTFPALESMANVFGQGSFQE